MDAKQEISNWLSSQPKDYATGASLYAKYGKSKNLARIFSLKYNQESTKEKLIYELQKLGATVTRTVAKKRARTTKPKKRLEEKVVVPTVEQIEEKVRKPKSKFSASEYNALPDQVKKLDKQWREMFKQRATVRATLLHLNTDKERYEAAELIMELGGEIQKIFDDIAYYKQFGFLPDREKISETVPNNLLEVENELRRVRSRISKKKKEKQTDELKAKLEEEMQYKELLLQKKTELSNNE